MPRRPALSKGELQIARAIWQLGQATVGQVYVRRGGEKA